MIASALAAVLVAASLTAPAGVAAGELHAECLSADWGSVSAPLWDRFLARGWYGDPTDGAERLYSPACLFGGRS